jgi:CDP-diacylglycerol pyrophosphatase
MTLEKLIPETTKNKKSEAVNYNTSANEMLLHTLDDLILTIERIKAEIIQDHLNRKDNENVL